VLELQAMRSKVTRLTKAPFIVGDKVRIPETHPSEHRTTVA